MAGKTRKLRDICAIDFTVINQQCVPVEIASCRVRTPTCSSRDVENGVEDTEFNSAHREDKPSPLSLHRTSTGMYPGSIKSSTGSSDCVMLDEDANQLSRHHHQHCGDSCSPGCCEQSVDPLFEEELMLMDEEEHDDYFVSTMKHVYARLGSEVTTSMIREEADRRWEDYESALDQQHLGKSAIKLLTEQRFTTHQQCQALETEIEHVRVQMRAAADELDQRQQHEKELQETRHSIDGQSRLAQLRLKACDRALTQVSRAYQMNIVLEDEAGETGISTGPSIPPDQDDGVIPDFDNASVSATPVKAFNGLPMMS